MRSDWRISLADAGAEFEDDVRVASFGNPEREKQITITGNIFCDLSHWGLLAAYGEDAGTFLQSQFGNDVSLVDEGHSQLSSLCTLKGRMFANFRLFKRGMTYYLRIPQALVEPTIKRLRMYVLRSRITLENADDTLIRIGCSGPDIESELTRAIHGKALPNATDQAINTPDYSLIRVAGIHPRFEIYGELEPMRGIWERLNVHAAPVGADNWDLLDILAGIPNIDLKTSEMFVPQMANMDLIGGISFTKGCYPGQEIVARTHYLGSLKRRMYRFHCQATRPPLIWPGNSH